MNSDDLVIAGNHSGDGGHTDGWKVAYRPYIRRGSR